MGRWVLRLLVGVDAVGVRAPATSVITEAEQMAVEIMAASLAHVEVEGMDHTLRHLPSLSHSHVFYSIACEGLR